MGHISIGKNQSGNRSSAFSPSRKKEIFTGKSLPFTALAGNRKRPLDKYLYLYLSYFSRLY